jgi:transposase
MARCRFGLTDAQEAVIEPLPPNKPCAVVRVDDRQVISGILWRFCKGSSWADIPERSGLQITSPIALCAGAQPGCGTGYSRR